MNKFKRRNSSTHLPVAWAPHPQVPLLSQPSAWRPMGSIRLAAWLSGGPAARINEGSPRVKVKIGFSPPLPIISTGEQVAWCRRRRALRRTWGRCACVFSRGSQLMKRYAVGKERCALSMFLFVGRECAPSANLKALWERQCGLIWRGSPQHSHAGESWRPRYTVYLSPLQHPAPKGLSWSFRKTQLLVSGNLNA